MSESILRLDGCATRPLGSYLKALGVLRLVGEQVDPSTRGYWDGDTFVLISALGRTALVDFFLDVYAPTPLVAPWNGGSGFGEKDQQKGIAAIESSEASRLSAYRDAIHVCRGLVARPDWGELEKHEQVRLCRNLLPDEALRWIDATVVLTAESRSFPPLLGTGGNVGRLEFSNNFMQNLAEVLGLQRTKRGKNDAGSALLEDALFGSGAARLEPTAIGQFDPGRAGGANSGPFGDAGSMVNRWDFVLAFEGALLFASGAARRMGSSSAPQAAMPYMVLRSTSGSRAAAEDENDKGELWAPIWTRAASAAEVSRLIGEGRADWRGRVAVDGLDMARAVASLGVDRGVDSFERYSFVERYGQAMLAVPQGRVTVAGRARPEVTVLGQLDNWLGSVRRRTSAPQGVRSLVRRVEAAQFVVTEHGGPAQVIDVLASAAELDAAVARSGGLRADVGPSPLLDAADWLPHLDDGSVEFRFALAVASQADPSGSSLPAAPLEYLRPVQRKGWRLEWSEAPALVPGLGSMPLVDVLSQTIERRAIDVGRSSLDGQQSEIGQMGVQPGWRWGIGAPTSVMHAMAAGELDDRQVERVLRGLLLLRFTGSTFSPTTLREDRFTLVPALRLLVPFVSPPKSQESVGGREPALRPGPGWWRQLGAGQVREVLTDAVRRLQIAGHTPRVNNVAAMAAGVDGPRLAASLAARSDSVARAQSLSAVVLTADEPEQRDRGREAINTTQEQET